MSFVSDGGQEAPVEASTEDSWSGSLEQKMTDQIPLHGRLRPRTTGRRCPSSSSSYALTILRSFT